MKTFFYKILCIIGYLIVSLLLSMQLAYFLSFHYDFEKYAVSPKITLDPRIMWWQGNDNYVKLAMTLTLVGLIPMLFWLIFPSKKQQKDKQTTRRMLSRKEKVQYSHVANKYEAKRGLCRLQFNSQGCLDHVYFNVKRPTRDVRYWISWIAQIAQIYGLLCVITHYLTVLLAKVHIALPRTMFLTLKTGTYLFLVATSTLLLLSMPISDLNAWMSQGNDPSIGIFIPHIRDYFDFMYDPLKRWWNKLMGLVKAKDNRKFNQLKHWKIADSLTERNNEEVQSRITCRKSGLPILTSKRKVWVEPENNHSLIIGTTNSGKTFSVIEGMIETTAMAGHCMFVNDLKGELYNHHKATLDRLGYKTILIDWINPERGETWNPFQMVITKYREAESKVSYSQKYLDLKKKWYKSAEQLLQHSFNKSFANVEDRLKVERLTNEVQKCKREAEAQYEKEPHPDFSEAFELLEDEVRVLCEEKNSKQPFFWQQASALMFGLITFLLEFEMVYGEEIKHLPDNCINFQNIKLLKIDGFSSVSIGSQSQFLIKWYLDYMLLSTSKAREKLQSMASASPSSTSNNDIFKTFENKISIGTLNEKIGKMTCESSFDFSSIVKEKTAIFMIVHDEKSTFYPFVTLFVTQFYNEIVKISREYDEQKLPIPFDIIWDEFGISPALGNIETVFAASRFRGVRWNIVIQEYSQLDNNYGKDVAKSIIGNVMNTVFLLANDPDTLKRISSMAGKTKEWNREKKIYEEIPVITEDELRHLSLSEAVILRQRKMPIKTRYYPYNRYAYYNKTRMKTKGIVNRELPQNRPFSLSTLSYAIVDKYDNI